MTQATATLIQKLDAGDWLAVEAAQALGDNAWPAVERAARSKQYRSRQIAAVCAARLRGPQAIPILLTSLEDPNINVRLAAANALSADPPDEMADAMLRRLQEEPDLSIREALALGAGYLSGEHTLEILRRVAQETNHAAEAARMALVRLGDNDARESLLNQLQESEPHRRYSALQWLVYIDDPALVPHAHPLLDDERPAQRFGTVRHPQYRRVCDQAVDTLVQLLKLRPSFETTTETIYTPAQISEVRRLIQQS